MFEHRVFLQCIEHSAVPRFLLSTIITVFTDGFFDTGDGKPLFLFEYFFDALIIILAFPVVVFSQNLFDGGLNDSGDVFMKLVVF